MIQFRGSAAGNCTRQIVLSVLDPASRSIPDAKRPFLDAGHFLQEHVEAFITGRLTHPLHLVPERRESEGTYTDPCGRWSVTGHVDGVLRDGKGLYLLEVKAIKDRSYKKLARSDDWREVYGHYVYQAQTYLSMPVLHPERQSTGRWPDLMGPFDGSHFIFYNRDTSEMMGSLEVDHDAYEVRPDMYEPRKPDLWSALIAKFSDAAMFIEDGEVPEGCDAEGYCFFCGVTGSTHREKRYKRVMILDGEDGFKELIEASAAIRGNKDRVLHWLNHYDKADELSLEDAYYYKRSDYE